MPAVAVLHRHTMRTSLPFLPDLHTADEDLLFFRDHVFPTNDVWVVDEGGALIAYTARGDGWLNQLYVHPDHQGRGLGDALLAEAMQGVDHLQLWAFQQNTRARRFYEKRGFKLVKLTDGSGNEERTPDALYEWRR
ncbi:MAG TPA: GNAT family N-acetyltransferase [Caulobacteraceae bacterium]|nr:GNAT family N-acetyltransferase [Caulobacteraceae bacterium]